MRAVFGLVLILGVALAGAAVYLVQGYVQQAEQQVAFQEAERAKIGKLVEVFVVNKPLAYGMPLTKEDVQIILWQESALPEGVFHDEATLFPPNEEPRYVLRPMEKFEPILALKVTEPGEPAGLTSRLTKGMRAFAINVDVASGVSGFVQPGDFVDVYWTGRSATEGGDELTQLIESGMKVIAIDQTASVEGAGGAIVARTVTVEATPEEVARLAQAQATGRLALSLVGAQDVGATSAVEVNQNALLGIQEEVAAPTQAKEVCTVTTRKGAEVVVTEVECPKP